MQYPVDEPIDAEFELLRTTRPKMTVRSALDRVAFAVVAVVVIGIFSAICAGAALATAMLSAI
jgi:hypothetical protein